MSFEWHQVFDVTHPEQFISLGVSGLLVGYLFAARMSAHLTVWGFGFRTAVLGVVFLGCLMASRFLSGSQQYELWVGVMLAFVVYTAALMLGIVGYDWQFKRAVERELGRSIRGNPRGVMNRETVEQLRRREGDRPEAHL